MSSTPIDGLRSAIRRKLSQQEPETPWNLFDLGAGLRAPLRRLGGRERSGHIDAYGLDDDRLRDALPTLDRLANLWWRLEIVAPLPPPPCLFVSNRAGALPWDALMVCHLLSRDVPGATRPRFLVDSVLASQPFLFPILVSLGGLRACRENAERVLRDGQSIVVFPERARGSRGRGSPDRPGAFGGGGIVRTARAAGCPVVPVAIVGGRVGPRPKRWHLRVGAARDVSTSRHRDDARALTESIRRSVVEMFEAADV